MKVVLEAAKDSREMLNSEKIMYRYLSHCRVEMAYSSDGFSIDKMTEWYRFLDRDWPIEADAV